MIVTYFKRYCWCCFGALFAMDYRSSKLPVAILFFYAVLFKMCCDNKSICSNDHMVHRSTPVTILIKNREWPSDFTSFAMHSNPRSVFTVNATNLWTSNMSFTLQRHYFERLDYLRTVNITNSCIKNLEGDTFETLIRLEIINLSRNKLTVVPENLFQKCKRLRELYLGVNQIQILPELMFSMNGMLSVLDLSFNHLEVIDSIDLFKKTKIKTLHLEGNQITTIYKNTFTELTSLEFLNLSYNKMSFPAFANCFDGPTQFPENYIWFVDMAVKTNGCVIDLRHNEILGLPLFGIQTSCTPINIRCKPMTLLLDNNPLSCDCEGFDLVRYFHNDWPSNVEQVVRINDEPMCRSAQTGEKLFFSRVDVNRVYCTLSTCPNCPANCSCTLHKRTRTVLVNCTGQRLEKLPQNLPIGREDMSEFWFSHNRIHTIDGITHPYFVKALAMSHNEIAELPQNFLQFARLKILELNNNKLRLLTPDHVKYLKTLHLERLTLGNNPWNCSDCRILSLVKYLQNSSNVIMDSENITCFETGKPVAQIDLDMCKVSSSYLFVFSISLLFLITLSVVFLLWYRMRLKIFGKPFKLDDSERTSKMYDAFISYAHQDEGYVINLVKNLEAKKNPFKLCLHSRDWMPGEFIVKQMADSVNNSRSSIIVLSSAYFRSKWCYSEFRIALTQMLLRRNHKVIAIWLSDEDPNKGKLDPDIRLYISACTYLKYNDEQFLSKLEAALMT